MLYVVTALSSTPSPPSCLLLCALFRPLLLMQWLHQLRNGMWVTLCSSTSHLLGKSGLAIARAFWCFSSCSSSPSSSLPAFLLSSYPSSRRLPSCAPPLCPSFHCPFGDSFGHTGPTTCPAFWKTVCSSVLFLLAPPSCPRPCTRPFPRRQRMSFVLLFSMYDPDASNTTLSPFLTIVETGPSALSTSATWNVTFRSCDPSAVDMISVFPSSIFHSAAVCQCAEYSSLAPF